RSHFWPGRIGRPHLEQTAPPAATTGSSAFARLLMGAAVPSGRRRASPQPPALRLRLRWSRGLRRRLARRQARGEVTSLGGRPRKRCRNRKRAPDYTQTTPQRDLATPTARTAA